ncbi:MAG: holin family protein [Halocynthiibacter sp.]
MGLMETVFSFVFGGGKNALKDTIEVFTENKEQGAIRDVMARRDALSQFGKEFTHANKGRFDRFVDGLNRLPRPMLAFGTIGLFVMAMVDPLWFSARMQGLQLVPEALWWLMGAIVSFYFGARHQLKGQEFQKSMAETLAKTNAVRQNIISLKRPVRRHQAEPAPYVEKPFKNNAALEDWRQSILLK